MKAMILAAGKGERMGQLTDHVPKPLLTVEDKPLLQYHIEALAAAGVRELVINHGLMGYMIETRFGQGESFNVDISYSAEGDNPLETGGGIKRALPLLGDAAFIVVNADIWTDYDFSALPSEPAGLAHLVLVKNPPQHPLGDFQLDDNKVYDAGDIRYTYSGIGVYLPALFANTAQQAFPLAPLLREAMQNDLISGELFEGEWTDVGTPQRLLALNVRLKNK